jgi:hypothetical protein
MKSWKPLRTKCVAARGGIHYKMVKAKEPRCFNIIEASLWERRRFILSALTPSRARRGFIKIATNAAPRDGPGACSSRPGRCGVRRRESHTDRDVRNGMVCLLGLRPVASGRCNMHVRREAPRRLHQILLSRPASAASLPDWPRGGFPRRSPLTLHTARYQRGRFLPVKALMKRRNRKRAGIYLT